MVAKVKGLLIRDGTQGMVQVYHEAGGLPFWPGPWQLHQAVDTIDRNRAVNGVGDRGWRHGDGDGRRHGLWQHSKGRNEGRAALVEVSFDRREQTCILKCGGGWRYPVLE